MGKLNDKAIQAAKPEEKARLINDGDNLSLLVQPNGTKLWWFRYRFGGKRKTLSLGQYPVVSLKDARVRALEARKLVAAGSDPVEVKKDAKAAAIRTKIITYAQWHMHFPSVSSLSNLPH